MSNEKNKALVRYHIDEVVNKGKLAVLDEIVAPNYVPWNPNSPMAGKEVGPEGVKQVFTMLHAAFPDLRQEIRDIVADDDRIATRSIFSGTQRGPFMGIPSAGKSFSVEMMEFWRIAEGKIVEHWITYDNLRMLQQLGAIPEHP